MKRSFAIALVIAATGCRGRQDKTGETPAPSSSPLVVSAVASVTPEERKTIEDVALGYLAAMSAKDCTTLVKIVANYPSADCKEDVEEWVEHGTQLIAMESIARDGRDSSAVLVTTKMTVSGKVRPMIVRVVRRGADWKVLK